MDDADEGALSVASEDVDAIRRRVINVVGHALRTPVTTLCGMAETLARTDDAQTRALLADGVVRNARVVERLLDQLLIAAGVTTALPAGDPSDIDLDDAVDQAWWALDPGEATVSFSEGADLTVHARRGALDHLLQLVLDNAAKYGDGNVVVRAFAVDGDRVRVEVVSQGDRPTDQEIDLAFELFYRGEHAVTRTKGLGIGLAVARQLAELEGGSITLAQDGDAVVTRIELPAVSH